MISFEVRDGLAIITLNRPAKANALTQEMLEDLIASANKSHDHPALVITGMGRVFSAGADLDAARAGLATSPLWEELSAAIAAHPGLTIAALNGTMAGGANGMGLACDLRIAVPAAKIFYPVMKLGFLPIAADVTRLRALIGPARTKLILMAGQKINAADALAMGLIDEIVDTEKLLPRAHELASDGIAAQPDILHKIKKLCT